MAHVKYRKLIRESLLPGIIYVLPVLSQNVLHLSTNDPPTSQNAHRTVMYVLFLAPPLPVLPVRLMLLTPRRPMLMMELANAKVSSKLMLINNVWFCH